MNRAAPMLARLLLFVIAIALPTLGCTSTRERIIKAGYAPAYVDGYEDGTSSAYNAARGNSSRVKQDTYRYDSDTDYRQGWDDGYSVSKRDYHSRH